MKAASILRSCLLAGAFWLYGSAGALAQVLPGPVGTGTCAVLDSTCAAADSAFVPTSVKVSVSHGVTTLACSGTTTTALPTKTTKCDGQTLGLANGGTENAPSQGCVITLGATVSPATDDWTETITKNGRVTLTCKSGGPDRK
jgi:hypothetical protein